MTEILTIRELAAWLKMSEFQVRSMVRKRGQSRMSVPLPSIKINGSRRFVRADVEAWLAKMREEAAA